MFEIQKLRENPALLDRAARWFHEKWGVPESAYRESMEDCLKGASPVPQWYVALEGGEIIGGLGVIENDFHDRKDLAPNVCAVYTEEAYRGKGIAGALLETVCRDMAFLGVNTLAFTSGMAGRFSVWPRGTGRKAPPGFTGRTR